MIKPQPDLISAQTPLRPNTVAYPCSADTPRPHPSIPQKTGQVFVFGSGVGGELGLDEDTNERRKPGNVKTLNDAGIVEIKCGGQHTLALGSDGRVYSWGVNDQGALGRPTEDNEMDAEDAWQPTPVDIRLPDGSQAFITQVVCADSFSAVLTKEGLVYAWGSFRDPSGVIGFSKDMEKQVQKTPALVDAFGREKVVLLGSGENHIFAVTSDDTVWAFGANDENQLGRRVSSRFKNNLQPYEIRGTKHSPLHGIVKITGGAYHTLYINSKGELYSFGCNNCGQLGLGDTLSHVNGPERVEFAIATDGKTRIELPFIVDIAAGESHSIAVSEDGRVFTWGANLENQLGYHTARPIYGDERDQLSTEMILSTGTRTKKTSPPSSASSSVNNTPQASNMSDFKLKFQPIPREIERNGDSDGDGGFSKNDPVVMVGAQSRFTAAVTSLGRLYTFGSGHCYQLGNEENEDEATPFKVDLKTRKCFSVSCGGQFTMFLLEPKIETNATTTPSSQQPQSHSVQDAVMNVEPVIKAPESKQPRNQGRRKATTKQSVADNFQTFRTTQDIPQSSLPGSPNTIFGGVSAVEANPTAQGINEAKESSSDMESSPRQKTRSRKTTKSVSPKRPSPTNILAASLENVWVSPEKKRPRVDNTNNTNNSIPGSPSTFTMEEKMAPWSPTKTRPPQSTSAATTTTTTSSAKPRETVMQRMRRTRPY